jgi:prepilin-type N-terminal cleavage/methylation domain-containing protein
MGKTRMQLGKAKASRNKGFTLIELSIVLVIIGLVVGGVLVARDLIRASEVRATISQIEKYNVAANTFRGKFGYLPGDIPAAPASQFGLAARGSNPGEGDGNGIIDGISCNGASGCNYGTAGSAGGETAMFWVDLSSAAAGNLIDGGFKTAKSNSLPGNDITGTNINLYLPQAKIGRGNYFYIYSADYWNGGSVMSDLGTNYFGLSAVNNIAASSEYGYILSSANIPVAQAYAIDKKIDDGLPQSGNVMAWYLGSAGDQVWTDGNADDGTGNSIDATATPNEPLPHSGALAGSATSCFDNNNNGGITTYSMSQNNGTGPNCALSFKFQ